MKKKTIVLLAALAWLNVGCKSDCEHVCEKSQECNSEDFDGTFLANASCGDLCDLSEEYADLANCEAEWDDFVACTANALPDEGCQPVGNDTCQAEGNAYSACFGFDDN